MTILLEKKDYPQVKVLESWPGGPLAEFSTANRPYRGWGIPFDPTGSWKYDQERALRVYKGSLVCGTCRTSAEGLYEPKSPNKTWECGGCRNPRTPKGDQN